MKKIKFGLNYNQVLSKYTTLKTGGFADYIISIGGLGELKNAFEWIDFKNMPYAVLGKGSKVLADDRGFRGAIVFLDRMAGYYFSDDGVYAQSGCSLMRLCGECSAEGLSGLEWASGIPATVGGAVVMNAGCFGGSVAEALEYVDCFDGVKMIRLTKDECKFGYRDSIFISKKNLVVTGARFVLAKTDKESILEKVCSFKDKRAKSQPKGNSAGSSFKRCGEISAGELIDKCGLKGYNIGAAKISEAHANFIVNSGGAQSADIEKLLQLCERTVLEKTGEKLEREILTLSENGWIF